MSSPLLVGITGGIGAGKSIVSKVFSILGVPVYDADSQAKRLMTESESLRSGICVLFGDESFEGNEINRNHIASQAFHNPQLLSQLNGLVHPAVQENFLKWIKINESQPYVLKEAALIFETGSNIHLDKTILVTAPERSRMDRVLKRDTHREASDVDAIMDRQLSDEEKEKLADIVLRNDGSELLLPQILKLHEAFSSKK